MGPYTGEIVRPLNQCAPACLQWDHLTEEIAYAKAVREQRLATELSAAKRERDFYLAKVGQAKAATAIAIAESMAMA